MPSSDALLTVEYLNGSYCEDSSNIGNRYRRDEFGDFVFATSTNGANAVVRVHADGRLSVFISNFWVGYIETVGQLQAIVGVIGGKR